MLHGVVSVAFSGFVGFVRCSLCVSCFLGFGFCVLRENDLRAHCEVVCDYMDPVRLSLVKQMCV